MKSKREFLCTFLFISSGIICAALYCLVDGKMITDIYLPSGSWNDEVFYYKQIEAAINYGLPQGYFGYGETSAEYLTYGAWSVAILLPYILFGKITGGWRILSPIFCNLFWVTIALFVFCFWVKPSKGQKLSFCLMLGCSPLITRFIISGMTEAFFFAAAILMAGIYFKLKKGEYGKGFLAASYFLVGYFSLGRPYLILMFFLPFWFLKKEKFFKAMGITIACALFTIIIYGIISQLLCAPYFTPIINWEFAEKFLEGDISGGVRDIMNKYISGLKEILGYLRSIIKEPEIGEYYLYFVIVNLTLIIIWLKERKNNKNKIILFTLGCNFIVMSAVIMLYSTKAGARHLLMFYVWGIVIISMYSKIWEQLIFIILAMILLLFVPKNAFTYSVPYGEKEKVAENRQIEKELFQVLQLEEGIGWNNTVAWIVDSEYGICYFLPPGFGINISYDGMIYNQMKSQYVLVKKNTITNNSIQTNSSAIWEHGEYILYSR